MIMTVFPGIDLRIAKFFAGQGTSEGLDLTGYITSGDSDVSD